MSANVFLAAAIGAALGCILATAAMLTLAWWKLGKFIRSFGRDISRDITGLAGPIVSGEREFSADELPQIVHSQDAVLIKLAWLLDAHYWRLRNACGCGLCKPLIGMTPPPPEFMGELPKLRTDGSSNEEAIDMLAKKRELDRHVIELTEKCGCSYCQITAQSGTVRADKGSSAQ